MADLRYRVEIDTQGAQRSLDSIKNSIASVGALLGTAFAIKEVTQLSSRFEDLRTTLQLLYKDTKTGALAFEDIKKFAETSIFSVDDLTQTIVKLKAAGLEPTVALLRLFADTSSVAADSVGALQAITDLYARTTAGGLGLEDLNRLADRGIPVFTILSERLGLSRLEIAKFGQTADGAKVILKALEDGLQEAFGGASAARAGNVSQAMSNLGDSISNASDAVGRAGLNKGISDLVRAFTDLVRSMTPVFEAFGRLAGPILTSLAENIKLVTYLIAGFVAAFAVGRIVAITTAVIGLARAFNILNLVVGKSPIGLLQKLIIGGAAAMGLMSQSSVDLTDKIDELGKSEGFNVLKNGELGAGTENLREKVSQLNQELNKFKAEMSGIVEEFARYNAETVKTINLDTQLLGTSKENQALRRAELDINRKAQEEIAKLNLAKAKLTEEEKRQGRAQIIDQTIAKIREQAEVDKKATEEAIKNNELKQRSEQLRLFGIEKQLDLQKELRKIQDDIAKSTLSEIERKYYDIDAAAREAAESAIAAERARRGGGELSAEEIRRYYEEAGKGADQLKRKSTELYDQSRRFSTGWGNAFRQYVDDATNAARQAERMFQKLTQGLEDLIVDFVKTGKFEWKSFVASMAEELLRSQIRQIFAQIMGSMQGSMGGGGILGSIGELFGFGGGGGQPRGQTPASPLYVQPVGAGGLGGGMPGMGGAGTEGGGIFSTIGNIFTGAKNVLGDVFSGIGSGIGKVVDTVGSAIGSIGNIFGGGGGGGGGGFLASIGSGISDLFGGFFANGGTLGAGKWGIAGERGPEIISGPANITPMGGMTNVVYNINAVDAMSFKALVAADPGFIHSVAMMGGQMVPSRR